MSQTAKTLPAPGDALPEPGHVLASIAEDTRQLMQALASERAARNDQERAHTEHTRRLLLEIIEAIDGFEQVFHSIQRKHDQVSPQMKKWTGNFRTVYRLLSRTLSEQGVSQIQNLDDGFDPVWHTVGEIVMEPSKPDGHILRQLKPGYVWQGQVIRRAEVVVVRNQTFT